MYFFHNFVKCKNPLIKSFAENKTEYSLVKTAALDMKLEKKANSLRQLNRGNYIVARYSLFQAFPVDLDFML